MTIQKNIEEVLDRVKKAASASNRNPDDVQLIAVTKTIDVLSINKALDHGIVHIGENKVQEIISKYDEINSSVKWHLIGHLQRNKVKYIIDKVDLIHSLDSFRLAQEINKKASDIGRIIECLLQINISGEETKYGLTAEETIVLLKEINQFENIKIVGLMTMAPHSDDKEETRVHFKALKDLSEDITLMNLDNIDMKYLSMGMSNDFEVAVEEGANLIRVGSAIFGDRDYSK